MKIIINVCFGGYELSDRAIQEYSKAKGFTLYSKPSGWDGFHYYTKEVDEQTSPEERKTYYWSPDLELSRTDPVLVEIVERLGHEANGDCSELKVVEIPDDVEYTIEEYDGCERIAEVHRTWQ